MYACDTMIIFLGCALIAFQLETLYTMHTERNVVKLWGEKTLESTLTVKPYKEFAVGDTVMIEGEIMKVTKISKPRTIRLGPNWWQRIILWWQSRWLK